MSEAEEFYDPMLRPWNSYMKFWGTRGSVPVSGHQHASFGGNTCCLEIHHGESMVIIDGGTGIRALGDQLKGRCPKEIHLIVGHTHWDHILGFPFFHPIYTEDCTVHIYGPEHDKHTVKEAFEGVLDPTYFPVRLHELCADVHFHTLEGGDALVIGDLRVSMIWCDHPGGALGFKIETDDRKVGYVTDNEFLKGYLGHPNLITYNHPRMEPYRPFVDFFKGCDPLIHEAQYTQEQYREREGWGHSSIGNATTLVKLCEVTNWIVTHHDPLSDDEAMRHRLEVHWRTLNDCEHDCRLRLASDGLTIRL